MDRGPLHSVWNFVRAGRPRLFIGLTFVLTLFFLSTHSSALTDLAVFGPKRYERLQGKPTVYTDTFERCDPSDKAILKVRNGDGKTTRIKSARIYINGAKIASEKDFKQKVPAFEKTVTIRKHNELKIVLKSGHHGYLDKLAKYPKMQAELEAESARLQEFRREVGSPESGVSSLGKIIDEIHKIIKNADDRSSHLDNLDKSLDDEAEDGEDESASDDEDEFDSGWVAKEREKLDQYREEIKNTVRETEKARDALDRTPKNKRDKDHEKKDEAFKDVIKLLKEIDRAIEKTLDRLSDIAEKIEKIKRRGPSFIIVEIIGQGCDNTASIIINPEPAEGALLNTAMPRISAQYADQPGGAGIDTKTTKLIVDGKDVTSSASVTTSSVSYTPASNLPEGYHTVAVSVSDLAQNPASLTWHFTTDTTRPVVSITTPQNGAVLNTPQITVSGTVNEPVTSVTINNSPAQVFGLTFSLSLGLSEGQNTITASATDRAGNPGTSTTVSLFLDTALPVISLNAPAQAAAGSNVTITHSTTENIGLTLSELLVNGMTIWSAALNSELSTQNSVLYSISPDLAPGTILNIQSRAYDTAGNIGTVSAQIQINQGPSGPGYIQGEIYDDAKGLRLEGATADFLATDGHGLTRITTGTDG